MHHSFLMKKILIIDDNASFAKALQTVLKAEGYDAIVSAGNGDMVALLEKTRPDVIMLDYLLGGKCGSDIVDALKKSRPTHLPPILAMSAHPSAHLQMAKIGVYSFITKPFTVDEVLRKISELCESSLRHRPFDR
jgi:DNA-binding response OmpR family regulator